MANAETGRESWLRIQNRRIPMRSMTYVGLDVHKENHRLLCQNP